MLSRSACLSSFLTFVCAALVGCGSGQQDLTSSNALPSHGLVFGGQQPVSGATVQLYATGSQGYSSASTALFIRNIVTDSNGVFNFASTDYTCPTAATPVYLVARGGNPGLAGTISNTAITLMSALGPCGAITNSTYTVVNEVTTVAAVWALQQFMSAYDHVGSSATNAAGLTNAFSIAADLANTTTGLSSANVSSSSTYSILVPSSKVNTFANILASCVNSSGGVAGDGSACGTLFANTTSGSGTAPTETVGAALTAALSSVTNASALFKLAATNGPFQPSLSSAPTSWTFSLTVISTSTVNGQAALIPDGANEQLTFDAAGNGWAAIASYPPQTLQMFYPNGQLGSSYAVTNGGGIAIDALGHFITQRNTSFYSTAADFSSTSTLSVPGAGFPGSFTVDGTGAIWYMCASSGCSNQTLHRMTSAGIDSGALLSLSSSWSLVPTTYGSLWSLNGQPSMAAGIINTSGNYAAGPFSICSACYASSAALDRNGALWLRSTNSNTYANSLQQITAAGSLATYSPPTSNPYMNLLGIDGDNRLWAMGGGATTAVSPVTVSGSSVSLTPYPADGPSGLGYPNPGIIDRSGNIWVPSGNGTGSDGYSSLGNTLSIFVGVAAPTITPKVLALTNNTVATRP